jgi:hypothetical protein
MGSILAVALPAAFAGAIAIAITVLIERKGGLVGGLLGTLPTTIVPAAIGILSQTPDVEAFRVAMYATPVGMLVNSLFLWTWRALPPRLPQISNLGRLGLMVLGSLTVWAAGAAFALRVLTPIRSDPRLALGIGVTGTSALVVVGVFACLRNPPAPRGHRRVSPTMLVARGLVAAAAIGSAIVLAKVGGPVAAGLAAVFPALFLTSMVSLWFSQGEAVQGGAVGPMMLGSGSVAAFAMAAAWALPALGLVAGTVVSWAAAVCLITAPAAWWLQRRVRPVPARTPRPRR